MAVDTLHRIQEASFARASEATRTSFPDERRMDAATLRGFLERRRYGVLATTREDGRPHAAPVGYVLVGSRFVIGSLADAARVRNLRAQPHASLVISQGEGPEHGVVIADGTARVMEAGGAPTDLTAPFRDPDGELRPWVGVVIAIQPERILSYAGEAFAIS